MFNYICKVDVESLLFSFQLIFGTMWHVDHWPPKIFSPGICDTNCPLAFLPQIKLIFLLIMLPFLEMDFYQHQILNSSTPQSVLKSCWWHLLSIVLIYLLLSNLTLSSCLFRLGVKATASISVHFKFYICY